jgi:hypothetical protein
METSRFLISLPQSRSQKPKHDLLDWIVEQLAILACAFGKEDIKPERLSIYARDLQDLGEEALMRAFTRARRECQFFPTISELRKLAGANDCIEQEVEARAAFQAVIESLERNGIDAGIRHLPERVQYAVRQCGGLFQFNQRLQVRYGDDDNPSFMDSRSPEFLQKDFIAAYEAFTVHKAVLPELADKGIARLPSNVREFLGAALPQNTGNVPDSRNTADVIMPRYRPKIIPQPLTDAQLRDRREILRQQIEVLKSREVERRGRGVAV